MTLKEMTDYFAVIKSKRNDIEVIEEEIHKDFEKNIISFFKSKGINFKLMNNKYDPVNRYYIDKKSDNFMSSEYSRTSALNEIERYYYTPKFVIIPYDFVIKFEWHKANNQNPTKVYWHPEEMSLETFYNKKLKKVLDLL